MKHTTHLAAAAALAFASLPALAANTTYTNRALFLAAAGSVQTDTYENAGYVFNQSDAAMSAVLGLTKYRTTGFLNNDLVFNPGGSNHNYCAGCNGTFELDFTAASLGGAGGISAAGFDFENVPGFVGGNTPYFAFVTFADSSTTSFSLAASADFVYPLDQFFGITSTVGITKIHLGLVNGGSSQVGGFAIDNLSVGAAAVPEPSTYAMLLAGLAGLTLMARRKSAV